VLGWGPAPEHVVVVVVSAAALAEEPGDKGLVHFLLECLCCAEDYEGEEAG
jgi:hypothetical protein